MRLIRFPYRLDGEVLKIMGLRECTLCDMHGCMSERVICNHPRADGRIAVAGAYI